MDAQSRRIRHVTFAILSSSFLVGFLLNDWFNWADECLVQYAVGTVATGTCFLLFFWWGVKHGNPSPVYVWTTVLLGSLTWSSSVMYQARWIFVYHPERYGDFITCTTWHWRQVPLTVVIFYLFSLIFGRLVSGSSGRYEGKP